MATQVTGCSNGRWFHYACVPDTTTLGGNWFCGDVCAASGLTNICICRSVRANELMKCKAGDKCDRGEYFHKECVPQLETKKASLSDIMVINLSATISFSKNNQRCKSRGIT